MKVGEGKWQSLQHESTVRVPAREPRATLTAQDYAILSEGAGSAEERTYRDGAFGIFVSAGLSVLGFVLSANFEDRDGSPNWTAISCICLASIVTLVSLAIGVIMWRRLKGATRRISFVALCARIEAELAERAESTSTERGDAPS